MNNSKNPESRADRRKHKENRLLNILIGAVVLAIIIVAFIVIPGGKDQSKEENKPEEKITKPEDKPVEQPVQIPEDEAEHDEGEEEEEVPEDDQEPIVTEPVNDPVIAQSIIDPSWEPIPTAQEGEHVSLYDGSSVDWQEKIQALSYATGLTEDNMTIWKLKNGGSPQKSIGIVSSKDTSEKYRVYLEWVDGTGWQPTEMDVLKTLDFKY